MSVNDSVKGIFLPFQAQELTDSLTLDFIKELEQHPEFAINDSMSLLEELETLEALDPNTHSAFFRKVLHVLDNYLVPIILLIGVTGNTLSFIVFMATHLKRISCHIYLASLAIADNLFLCCVFVSWVENIGISLYNHHGWCQILMFLTNVSKFLSVWYVVSFTVERWLATCYPLRQNRLYTAKNAKVVVSCLAFFALFVYSYTLFTSGVLTIHVATLCAPLPQYHNIVSTVDNVDTLITLIIPIFIIIGCNIHITYIVCSIYKTQGLVVKDKSIQKWDFSQPFLNQSRKSNHFEFSMNSNNNRGTIVKDSPKRSRIRGQSGLTRTSHMRATRMLLIVSSVFIVCNLPNHTARTYAFVRSIADETYSPSATFILLQNLFQILNYINFSMNFFLYNLSGRSFRNGLGRLKMKIKRKAKGVYCARQGSQSVENIPNLMSIRLDLQLPSQ